MMTVGDIVLVDIDIENAKLGEADMIKVPYVLSDVPPKEWKEHFLNAINARDGYTPAHLDPSVTYNAEIISNQVIFECPSDEAAVKKDGKCWRVVAAQVAETNRWYSRLERQRKQEQERIEAQRRGEEERRRKLDELKRHLSSDEGP
jgi:hypothetical protein